MKKNNLLVNTIAVIIAITFVQCSFNSTTANSSGEIKKEERNVSIFKSVGLAISADVYVTQGSPQKLVLEGPEKDLNEILTEVDGDNLKIKTKFGSWNLSKIKIYITMENIDGFSASGSGSIKTDGPIHCDYLSLAVSGSGSIEIGSLKAKNIESAVSGSGSIHLSGADAGIVSHKIRVSGSGDIYAEDLQTQDCEIGISGSGSCRVYATGNLNAHVSGSGKVYYKGAPVVNASVSGSGKVKPI